MKYSTMHNTIYKTIQLKNSIFFKYKIDSNLFKQTFHEILIENEYRVRKKDAGLGYKVIYCPASYEIRSVKKCLFSLTRMPETGYI